jgi:NAD-dependent dihydropyrimidine dehydrogenase PreA subunit
VVRRKIIEIDEEKCDGCGQCVIACEEGALKIIEGKAKVVNEVFCDGLGACIGECPQGALRIIEREAPEFDEEAVKAHMSTEEPSSHAHGHACGCPSATPISIRGAFTGQLSPDQGMTASGMPPELVNWPVQWRLIQPSSPFFRGADILIAADCAPFAYRDFHGRFMKGKPVVIGCPKLEEQAPFLEKLTALLRDGNPKSLTVVMIEVPCCQGLTKLVSEAMKTSGKTIPLKEYVIGIKGDILKES